MLFKDKIKELDHKEQFYTLETFECDDVDELIKTLNTNLIFYFDDKYRYMDIRIFIRYLKINGDKRDFVDIQRKKDRPWLRNPNNNLYTWIFICDGPHDQYEEDLDIWSEKQRKFEETKFYKELNMSFEGPNSIIKDDIKDTMVEYYNDCYKNT